MFFFLISKCVPQNSQKSTTIQKNSQYSRVYKMRESLSIFEKFSTRVPPRVLDFFCKYQTTIKIYSKEFFIIANQLLDGVKETVSEITTQN